MDANDIRALSHLYHSILDFINHAGLSQRSTTWNAHDFLPESPSGLLALCGIPFCRWLEGLRRTGSNL